MSFLTIANMKKGVLLHKLILLEVRIVPRHNRNEPVSSRLTLIL